MIDTGSVEGHAPKNGTSRLAGRLLRAGIRRRSGGDPAVVALRRELRTTKMENEILKPSAAYFAKEHVLPK